MKEKLLRVLRLISENIELRDGFFFSGLGLTSLGIALIYVPASLIFAGAVCMWLGLGKPMPAQAGRS